MITDPSFRSGLLNSIRNTRATLLRTDLLGPQLDSLQEMDNPESTYFLTTQSDSLFASLPTEIVLKICFQLDVAALVAIAKTCSLFWNIVKDETLWKHRIKHDYLLIPDVCLPSKREKNSSGSSITARCYYTHFLHSIGKCVGIWWQKSDGVSTRGGLLHIRFEGPDLVCDKITPSKIFRDDPIKSKYFFAKLDDLSLNIIFQCFMGRKLYSIQLSEEGNTLMTEVEKRLGQNGRPTNGGQRGGIHDCSDKLGQLETFQRLSLVAPRIQHLRHLQNLPETGIYQGSYRELGSELVQVFISDDPDSPGIYGRKVTGDQYVPAGETTFTCNLQAPLHPSSRQMQSMTSLRLAKICQKSDCLCPIEFPFQPLHIPEDCRLDVPGYDLPSFVVGWFEAAHIISYPNFSKPEKILAHFVVFSRLEFGLFIFQLNDRTTFNSFSIFRKLNIG